MLRSLALLGLVAHSQAWYKDIPVRDRGDPPYPYPASHSDGTAPVYDVVNEKDGPVDGKINVHLVPHTHDDTGWQVTVDQYFFTEVYYVVDTVVDQLVKNPKRHFIYVETGFFARWWDEQPDDRRNVTKALVANGQLEFINGAWCMHDEASPLYTEMIDQTTRGHQFLKKNFGDNAIPRGTWQIDPFGHSNTEAWLLGAEAGMESLFWGRTDYQDLDWRKSYPGHMKNQWTEWVWEGSQSLGKSAEVFAGELGGGGYGAPIGWDGDGGAIQDNPSRHDYNLDSVVEKFIQSALGQANFTKGKHQMWPCGSDFQYQNADHWFHNLDKIIHYVNVNAKNGGPVVAFYSTPSHYTDAKHKETLQHSAKWEVRSDDIFPLGDNAHAYWSGYFTSRPSLKRQVRFATNFLAAARQMEVIANITAAEVDHPTVRPSPPVGQSWSDSMEGAIGVATHHDGMSGTERQDVANDYSQRISEGHFEVEAGVALALKKLTGITGEIGHCNCNSAGNCLNISMCAYTTGVDEFTVIAWNTLAQNTSSWLRLPVSGGDGYTVTDLSTKATVPSQALAIDDRTKQLPLLYINKYKMSASQLSAAQAAVANNATHILTFAAPLPPVGYNTFLVKKSAASSTAAAAATAAAAPSTVSNGVYEITLDHAAGTIGKVTNLLSNVEVDLNLTWGYYVSSEGDSKSAQSSGAYMFRPATQETYACGNSTPTLEVTTGPLVTEIKSVVSEWATHIIRLTKGSPYIEVEWTAGPIPMNHPPPPPPPPPTPPMAVNLSGKWNVDLSGGMGTLAEAADGSYTVTAPANSPGWKTAKGKITGKSLTVAFSNGVKGTGTISADNAYITWHEDKTVWARAGAPPAGPADHLGGGKEIVLKFDSSIASTGTFYTDSNGREMVKRQRNARGPSYPPYQVGEPVAGNYYPVNSLISLNDAKNDLEMAVVVDTTMGGSSMADGSLEVMVHRRCQKDDSRGVQEPINETMCGCNDINAMPGKMGEHGHEGDGGCDCEGLTMRGSTYLIIDTIATAHETRRQLIETLNFPPTLAFASGSSSSATPSTPMMSAIAEQLPANVKLMTVSNNYAEWNEGQLILRLAHLYQVDEHPTLSKPVTFSLADVFAKSGLKVTAASETMLSANQARSTWESKKLTWPTTEVVDRAGWGISTNAQDDRVYFDNDKDQSEGGGMTVTLNAMEVKTYLVTMA